MQEDILINEAITGRPIKGKGLIPSDIQQPWKIWHTKKVNWAIYNITGTHWPKTTDNAIKAIFKEEKSNLKPCLLVSDSQYLGTVAKAFVSLRVPIIVQINGSGSLIKYRKVETKDPIIREWGSRISPIVLRECAGLEKLNTKTQDIISKLEKKYRNIRIWNDEKEQQILREFSLSFCELNGLDINAMRAHDFLRNLEQSGMRNDRDHYFHSFQNFFFGLFVIGEAWDYFNKWLKISKLNWNISIEFVWYLVSMWHDVGYGVQLRQQIENDIFGIEVEGLNESLSDYLANDSVIEGKKTISSLIEHLLKKRPKTAWMLPQRDEIPTTVEAKIEIAINNDVRIGHGAASALRLYTDMKQFISKCAAQTERNILTQSTCLAAASIPFHDWRFRACFRQTLGICRVPALTMPFAGLLAFVDSIQEDRRKFIDIKGNIPFLHYLIVTNGRIISAEVDGSALAKEDIIWKIVEATDVLAALERTKDSFDVEYPKWLVA